MLIGGVALSFTGIGATVGIPLISAGLTGLSASYGFYLGGYTAGVYGHAIIANNISNESDLEKSKNNLNSDIIEGIINLATIGIGGLVAKLAVPSLISWGAGSTAGRNILKGLGYSTDVINAISYDRIEYYSRPDPYLGNTPAAIAYDRLSGDIVYLKANDLTLSEKLFLQGSPTHERGGENPSNIKGLIKIPQPYGKDLVELQSWFVKINPGVKVRPDYAKEVYQESLAPDIIGERIDPLSLQFSRLAFGEGSQNSFFGGPNWRVICPDLVTKVEQNIPEWYSSPNLVYAGGVIAGEGTNAINNTFDYY